MAFTTKDVRPVFERTFGATRRFVVKGGIAFAVLTTGEPMFGFVVSAALPRVESCVSLSSHSVPLSVVPPQWFANAVDEFTSSMVDNTQWNYWATLVIASKTLGSNSGRIQLDEHHPFAQHAGVAIPHRARESSRSCESAWGSGGCLHEAWHHARPHLPTGTDHLLVLIAAKPEGMKHGFYTKG